MDGKDKLFGFFIGQIMKESKGQANPNMVNEILKNKLYQIPSLDSSYSKYFCGKIDEK